MNNESINFSKIITTVSNTSTPASSNYSSSIISSSASTANILSPKSSSLSLSSTASTSQSYSTSAQFDVTVNAIAAVVNASNNLPVTTPPNAAAVVAVAVSSLAAAIIPDTPIVSIAGSTLSEITTTTTSTKTTPTPVPTSKESESSNNLTAKYKTSNKDFQNKTLPSSSSSRANPSSSYSTSRASAKGLDPMSVANSSVTGALTNASTTAANAGAVEIKTNTNSIKHIKDIATGNSAKGTSASSGTAVTKSDSLAIAAESKSITATTSSQPIVANATVSTNKTDESNVTPNQTKSKDSVSESWEESRIKDWDDSKLKELLDEAYSYKNPRDKENKSKTFLQLLEKAENEDQSYPFCVTSRGSRNLSNSITSNSYHHYQQSTHYHSHNHNHNRSHHHHKQGGSLQDLFEIGLHETQLDCDQTFGIGISGNQRTRRQNHNSRQKKYSSSVSSRQREGGSLPSNVNVTHQMSLGGSGVVNDLSLLQQEATAAISGLNPNKSSKKEQRRNATKAAASAANAASEVKDNNSAGSSIGEAAVTNKTTTSTTNSTYTTYGGDFVIDIGEPMIDIQQQQKILQCKGQDAATQGHPFYERLATNDKRIPRANIIGSTTPAFYAPTISHTYVDEAVRFNALERNGCTTTGSIQSTIDAKFLPLDDNYKSCKSVLGSDSDEKSPEMLGKSKTNTIYTKISSPASGGSAILTGTTNNITTLTSQRHLDENGNSLNEIYQNSTEAVSGTGATIQINAVSPTAANASAALLNSCGNVSTSATVTISPHTASTTVSTSATVTTAFTSGPSQAKAKAKKKSQQERNTTTVAPESVAGYRGTDPVEELVKYIESSGEDKQTVSKSGDKKKDRKKDKEKHQKLKKSNSLEELRSGAKMEVHELKRTAATTESNAVMVRQKSGGGGGGKQNKNNSSSTADINKNLDSKTATQTTTSRKSDRRSWGNEDLKYLEDQQNANLINEEKYGNAANTTKERKSKLGSTGGGGANATLTISPKEDKEIKDKTIERNERNLSHSLATTPAIDSEKFDKPEKSEKTEKTEKSEKKLDKSTDKRKKQDIPANAVTVVDILAIESVLPETAEFHVVTKKKKPKKQKVINNLEETTVTFNRTHNFTMQKTSTFNQQQQQMTVRYKYYHHDNSNMNTNSQHYQQPCSQQQQQQHQPQPQQSSNSNANNVAANNTQQQHNENYTNTNDKSRRKSTSSVPPSEKSDSSDLDSVHSLPIESSKANTTNPTNLNTNKTKNQARSKATKNTQVAVLANNMTANVNKTANLPAPISYADIARTNKEIADAAAAGSSSGSGSGSVTSPGSASGILINNNEISTECRNADIASLNDTLSADEKSLSSNNSSPNTSTTVAVANLNAANLKSHKIKKSQIKQDFPELSSTLAAAAGSNDENKLGMHINNQKTITYSQSLTAVTNPMQNVNANQNTANDSSPTSLTDANTKTCSPPEQLKNVIVHQHANIPPLQHPQQMVLQKSKSVENDSTNSSTMAATTTSSATSPPAGAYMAPLNSNNLDQQYPALEKTVKRHSSVNATMLGTSTNPNSQQQQTPFNFAAAAKQQIASHASPPEQYVINANKNSALTTSNTNNNSNTTNQVALITANKKSKEKTPPLTAIAIATATNQQMTPDNIAFNANLATTAAGSALTNPKKSKKERQQQHQVQQQTTVDNSTHLKQNQNINNTLTTKKPLKTPLKSSNSLPLGLAASAGSSSNTSSSVNRPAVIILNDYRNAGSCAADNQFTFGDFNEDELKLFDDDNNTTTAAAIHDNPLASSSHDINMNQTEEEEEEEKLQHAAKSEAILLKSPTATYFNDSGTSCGHEMVNNSCSELLSASMEASSPNTSYVVASNNIAGASHLPSLNSNQSSDSGIYSDKTKSASSTFKPKQQSQQITPTKEENDKLNSFLSKTRSASVHNSMDNLAQAQTQPQSQPQPPPPQQLETCNDIETAIIAAARAAAKHQRPAPPNHHHHHQQQQQLYKNSNTSSNSSSFSSSSISSTSSSAAAAAAAGYQQHQHHHQLQQHQHQNQNQQHQHHLQHHHQHLNSNSANSNKHYHQSHQYGRGGNAAHNMIMSHHHHHHHHQQPPTTYQPQHDEDYDHHDDNYVDDDDDTNDTFSNTPRSRSPSRPRRISIAGGTVANKEFDIHFIPPTTMPTAFTTQQHNDIIVDFIGSAWEEVANSKVTKVYDGQ